MMNQKKKKILSLLIVGVLLVVAITPVFAISAVGEDFPPATPMGVPDEGSDTPIKDRAIRFLENTFERAGKLVGHVGTDLERIENMEERISRVIQRQEEMGEDTSEIQTALEDFLVKVPGWEADYAEAVSIYERHAGFDGNGKVIDIDDAGDTLQALKDTLLVTHQDFHEAASELRDVLEAYRDVDPGVYEN